MRREEALANLEASLSAIQAAKASFEGNEYQEYLSRHLVFAEMEIKRQIQCIKGRL